MHVTLLHTVYHMIILHVTWTLHLCIAYSQTILEKVEPGYFPLEAPSLEYLVPEAPVPILTASKSRLESGLCVILCSHVGVVVLWHVSNLNTEKFMAWTIRSIYVHFVWEFVTVTHIFGSCIRQVILLLNLDLFYALFGKIDFPWFEQ